MTPYQRSFIFIALIMLPFGLFADGHDKKSGCLEDDISVLYRLIYGNYLPFEPPLDEEGNVTLSEEQLFVMKSKHYFNQIKDVEPVKISLSTYASLSKEVPEALSDYETKIKIILPDCQIISLYKGSPIETISADFDTVQLISKAANDANLNSFKFFAANKVELKPILFDTVIEMLENDYAFDSDVLSNLMPKKMIDRYFPDKNIPVANLSEAALLTFISRGGQIKNIPKEVFFIVPKSFAGISENFSAIMLVDNGNLEVFPALNTNLIVQLFNRYGIKAEIISLREVFTDQSGSCNLDPAGRWFQLIGGRKIRNCPFFSLTHKMLKKRSYLDTVDFIEQNTNYTRIDEIIKDFVLKNSVDG
ncbi:hypothetical protein OA005_01930 [Paracoccaceae bacterium]|nr:hypothetical protein [Paracoccaceae bacterium]